MLCDPVRTGQRPDEGWIGHAGPGLAITYGPATEPCGVRRVYLRDPFGRLVNVLAHD